MSYCQHMSFEYLTPYSWHILGAGSMGCFWAYQLAKSGQKSILILRDEKTLETYHQLGGGISFEFIPQGKTYKNTPEEPNHKKQIPIPAQTALQGRDPITHLILGVKCYDATDALSNVAHRLAENAIVILLQNGMGSADQIQTQYPKLRLIQALTYFGVHQPHRFSIRQIGDHPISLGTTHTATAIEKSMKKHINDSLPFEVVWGKNFHLKAWGKLAINCAINPLTALLGCRNGKLLEQTGCLKITQAISHEIAAVMRAEGMTANPKTLFETICMVAKHTESNYSSMLQDIQNNKLTEINYLNGFVCQRANYHQLQVPFQQLMTRLIQIKESTYVRHEDNFKNITKAKTKI